MKESILPVDNFVVINKTIINDNFRDLVVMLYQPIIGFPSVSVYFTLWSYLKKSTSMSKEYSHYNLLSNMKINIITILIIYKNYRTLIMKLVNIILNYKTINIIMYLKII